MLKYVLAVAFVLFMISDLFLSRQYLRITVEWSYFFQTKGGEPVHIIGQIFSTVITAWMFPFIVLYGFFSNSSRYFLYHFTKYYLAVIFGLIIKTIWYQGRPYLIDKKIIGCTCDPGMPSGHTIVSISGYYMIYVVFSEKFDAFKPELNPKANYFLKVMAILMPLGIMWSRVSLGAHGFNQILAGALISGTTILWFQREDFDKLYEFLEKKATLFASSIVVFLYSFGLVFLLINHTFREDTTDFWVNWSVCPKCMNSFVNGQTNNLVLCFLLPGCLFMYPYAEKKEQPETEDTYQVYKRKWMRLFIFLILLIAFPLAVLGLGQFLVKPHLTGVYSLSFYALQGIAPVVFWAGMVIGFVNDWVCAKLGFDESNRI